MTEKVNFYKKVWLPGTVGNKGWMLLFLDRKEGLICGMKR